MEHADHVNLLRDGIKATGGVWADFGAGTGAFTLALAELIGSDGEIHSIDKDARALRTQEQTMHAQFVETTIHCHVADFTQPIVLPELDGIVIANALHFQRRQQETVQLLRSYL